MECILTAENVSKKFAKHVALDDLSLAIPKNCIFGLLGPNGAGKTTFIRIINNITQPDSGRIYFDGELLKPEHIQQIGYLPEERGLYKSMKVGEQALYLAQLKGLSKKDAKKKLKHWFERLEIGEWWNKKIQELSKGMAQKIQFVVTVLHEPKLLIFDEPFSGFDPINANKIKDEIFELNQKGTSIIFSTHRMESVEEICDHIALLNNSKKVLDGRLKDIKRMYQRNIYDIGIQIDKDENEITELVQKDFPVLESNYDPDDKQLRMTLKLPNNDTRAVLAKLTAIGHLNHFNEILPSVNDIFIRAVEGANQ